MFQMVHVREPHRPQMSVGCDECVCVCVLPLRFGGHFFQQQNRVSSDGYQGERRLEDRICHMKQVLS